MFAQRQLFKKMGAFIKCKSKTDSVGRETGGFLRTKTAQNLLFVRNSKSGAWPISGFATGVLPQRRWALLEQAGMIRRPSLGQRKCAAAVRNNNNG